VQETRSPQSVLTIVANPHLTPVELDRLRTLAASGSRIVAWQHPSIVQERFPSPDVAAALRAEGVESLPLAKALGEKASVAVDEAVITWMKAFGRRPLNESGGFRYVSEIWGPTPAQLRYPDGPEWKGHGLIQITHKSNHLAEAKYFGIPPSDIVRWLQTPEGACRSAAHYWRSHGCNEAADAFDFVLVTKKINGGVNGLADRLARYNKITAIA